MLIIGLYRAGMCVWWINNVAKPRWCQSLLC